MSVIINGETGINKIQDFTIIESPVFTGTVVGVTKTMVGLSNVDNTTDVNKPVSSATQTALNLKANLSSPDLTGTPTAPTASSGTNNTQLATTQFACNMAGGSTVPAISNSVNGYMKMANGLIVQWMTKNPSGANSRSWTFPIAFPNAVFSIQIGQGRLPTTGTAITGQGQNVEYVYSCNLSSCSSFQYNGGETSDPDLMLLAIGN